jgi:hypothetical protein
MDQIIPNAALPDERPAVLRDRDLSASEIMIAAAVAAFLNPKPTQVGATLFNQWYVGSCVPHGTWTMLEYEGLVPAGFNQSQLRSYRKRSNYPSAGSNGVDMLDLIRAGQSNDFPTPVGFTEAQATAMPRVEGTKQIKDFKYFQYIDKKTGELTLDLVPADVAIGKAVAIFIYATEEEWSQEYVQIQDPNLLPGDAYVRHCVCIMPKGDFTENGKQWLAVQDSAAFGNRQLRYVSFDFFKKRCYFAVKAYAADQIPQPAPVPPAIGKPTTPCQLGDRGSAVLALQTFLLEQKKLEAQYVTGYYGAITAKAVQWWQLEHWNRFTGGVPALLDLAGKYWGKESIAIINS